MAFIHFIKHVFQVIVELLDKLYYVCIYDFC